MPLRPFRDKGVTRPVSMPFPKCKFIEFKHQSHFATLEKDKYCNVTKASNATIVSFFGFAGIMKAHMVFCLFVRIMRAHITIFP